MTAAWTGFVTAAETDVVTVAETGVTTVAGAGSGGGSSSVGPAVLQSGSIGTRLVEGAAEVAGLALLAAVLAGAVALAYRWYARERVPGGLPALFGLSGVAIYLNSTTALRQVIGNTGDPFDETVALFNIVAVLVSLGATRVGTDVGDRVGVDVFVATGGRQVEAEVSRIVQAVGRVITVELPDEVDDIVGYDPVPAETKDALAGRTFVFPRRLTVAQLRDRLITRLQADYAVGHVDVELADDGTVEYLAVGSRASGIGPTLPPETSAVAIRADPAFAASAGDLVQVWRTDPMERLLTAELRGTVGDVVTLAVDAADTRKLADDAEYKLVTLPVETRPDREFAAILRAAEETMAAVTVGEGAPLAGQPVGSLDVVVVAVRPPDGPVEALPARDRRLTAGDSVYLIATPDAIRKVEAGLRPGPDAGPGAAAGRGAVGTGAAGAVGTETAGGDAWAASPGAAMPADRRIDAATPVASDDAASGDDGPTDVADSAPDSADDSPGDAATDDGTSLEEALADDDQPGIRTLERQDSGNGDEGDPLNEWTTLDDDATATSADPFAPPEEDPAVDDGTPARESDTGAVDESDQPDGDEADSDPRTDDSDGDRDEPNREDDSDGKSDDSDRDNSDRDDSYLDGDT